MSTLGSRLISQPAVRDARLHLGQQKSVSSMIDLVDSARHHLVGELFKGRDSGLVDSLLRAGRRTGEVHLLVDAESRALGRFAALEGAAGVQLIDFGQAPLKLHTKVLVADGERAIVSTSTPLGIVPDWSYVDLSVELWNESALAVEDATRAAMLLEPVAIAASAQRTAAHGVYSNDPAHGVRLLTPTMKRLIRASDESLDIIAKRITDKDSIKELGAAVRGGSDVRAVVGRHSTARSLERLAKRHVDVALHAGSPYVHANVILGRGTSGAEMAYAGTAYLSRRTQAHEKANRPSREMGVLIDDPQHLAQLREWLASELPIPVRTRS